MQQHELADVVEEGRGEQLVARGESSSRASRSAAAWVATAWRRKRSAGSQPGVRSKKSNTLARLARCSTPSGVITPRPRDAADLPFCLEGRRLAIRRR